MISLPAGAHLSAESFAARHGVLVRLLWAHPPVLMLVGVLGPRPTLEALLLPMALLVPALAARVARTDRARAELVSLGLMSGSYVAIELSGGMIEAHFHLFAILVFVALYQLWRPLLLALASVLVHHLGVGLVAPHHVFGVPMPAHHALGLALLHGALVGLEIAGILLLWHHAEQTERQGERIAAAAAEARDQAVAEQQDRAVREADAERIRAVALQATARQVAGTAAVIRAGATRSAAAMDAVSEHVATLSGSVTEVADRTHQATGAADSGRRAAESAAQEVQRLEQSMGEIASLNGMIAQLAEQTNLLSLNATIEAARAGEAGKGFAVVAHEVKQLAGQTAKSASTVRSVVDTVVGETDAVTRGFASTSAVVGEIHALQIGVATAVTQQGAAIAEVSRHLATAAAASVEIIQGVDELMAGTATM